MVIPSLEGWPTKAKEAPSPHDVRLIVMDSNPVFLCLGDTIPNVLQPFGIPSSRSCIYNLTSNVGVPENKVFLMGPHYLLSFFCSYSVQVYTSLHFLPILLVKLGFHLSMFWFFLFLYLWLSIFSFALCFEFNVFLKDLYNNLTGIYSIMCFLILFSPLFKRSVKI